MKDKIKSNKKLTLIIAIIICVVVAGVIYVCCTRANPAYLGTWTTEKLSDDTVNRLKDKGIDSIDKFGESAVITLKLDDGLFAKPATLFAAGMQQTGSWSSNNQEGNVTIGKTTAELHLDGDTLIMKRGNTTLTLKKQ